MNEKFYIIYVFTGNTCKQVVRRVRYRYPAARFFKVILWPRYSGNAYGSRVIHRRRHTFPSAVIFVAILFRYRKIHYLMFCGFLSNFVKKSSITTARHKTKNIDRLFLLPVHSVADPGCLCLSPGLNFSIPDPGYRSKRSRILIRNTACKA